LRSSPWTDKFLEPPLPPGFFFFGEESFLAWSFIEKLRLSLASAGEPELQEERFLIGEQTWTDVIDEARSVPLMFLSYRLIVVLVQKGKADRISEAEKKRVNEYLADPPAQTILIIIYRGKIPGNSALVRFFSSQTQSVRSREVKRLREDGLQAWIEYKLRANGRQAERGAINRLLEFAGNDMAHLDSEIEKIITFLGDKKTMELDDVNQVSGWVKSFFEWEFTDSLEKADYEQCLLVLDKLVSKEGVAAGQIAKLISWFLRDILFAKLALREKELDREAIFSQTRPQIRKNFGALYSRKFRQFFDLVDRVPMKRLRRLIMEMEQIDFKMKSSHPPAREMLERLIFSYTQHLSGERRTSSPG